LQVPDERGEGLRKFNRASGETYHLRVVQRRVDREEIERELKEEEKSGRLSCEEVLRRARGAYAIPKNGSV
jgi:hypothetical protein